MRNVTLRLLRATYLTLGAVGWLWVGTLTVFLVWTSLLDPAPFIIWLYDWHVYAAGARDLVEGTLYVTPLHLPGWPLPVDTYNLPPVSAAWAVPLLVLPDSTAGVIWITVGAVSWVSAWWLILRMGRIPHPVAATGIALALYSLTFYWYGANVLLGNINHLVLGLLAATVLAYVRGRDTVGGVLLGVAMATKLWPAVLVVPLIRERRWTFAAWSIGTASLVTALPMMWLGIDAVGPLFEALRLSVPIEPGVAVLWTTAARLMFDWWPAWGGFLVAALLLALPGRGLSGIGLAIVAGISAIPNIWDHYLPTLMFAAAAIAIGTVPQGAAAIGRVEHVLMKFRPSRGYEEVA